MDSDEELFESDMISRITQFVESKEDLLKNVKEFKEKDKMLLLCMEDFEKDLSKKEKERFDKIIKLIYQTEEYYIALAYVLGTKYGENIEHI